ncbi:MAG: 50S ribosomal protein L11 methyltransferase [Anaerolineales bacterium]
MTEAGAPSAAPRQWLEVSVPVDDEMAEPVADLLAQYADQGVVLSYADIGPEPEAEGTPCGGLLVSAYLPVDQKLEDTRARLLRGLWHLGQIRPLSPANFRLIQDRDWTEEWKRSYRPIRIAPRLVICPSWIELPPQPGEVFVRLDPGMAFGTGTHPSTRMCLEAIQELLPAGSEVIDLGCGSGILAIAALRLGASRALALDIDPEAVRTTLMNSARNGVSDRLIVLSGSLPQALAGTAPIQKASLVLVNILAHVAVEMLRTGLTQLVLPGGHLVLSGILAGQSAQVEQALVEQGFVEIQKRDREDWVAFRAERRKG